MINKIIFLLILLTVSLAQTAREVIAVSDISNQGLESYEIKSISNKIESELVNLGKYDVTSRQDVEEIIKEMKFQKSGCTDQQCAAEIGKILNADIMLLPDVNFDKASGFFNLSLKIVDVETAKIRTSLTKDHVGVKSIIEINDRLGEYLVELYRQDNKDKKSNIDEPEKEKEIKKGNVEIVTNPVGAYINLGGVDKGITPQLVQSINTGQHKLIITLDGYERLTKTIQIYADSTITINEILSKKSGNLQISTSPNNCDIYTNSEYRGKSPVNINGLDIGEYRITASCEGYYDYISTEYVEYNFTKKVDLKLEPKPGKAIFYTTPDGVDVILNGKSIGKTNSTGFSYELKSGNYLIQFKKKNYFEKEKNITILPGGFEDVEITLKRYPPTVSDDKDAGFITLNGWPEKTNVKVGGKNKLAPFEYLELKYGEYNFKVSKKGYRSKTIPAVIRKKRVTELEYSLEPIDRMKARTLSWVFPGLGHYYAENKLKGILFASGEIICLSSLLKAFSNYSNKIDEMDEAYQLYINASQIDDIESKRNIYSDAFDDKVNAGYIVTGIGIVSAGFWIWNVIDTYYSLPQVQARPMGENFKVGMNSKNQIEVSYRF